MRKDVLKKMVLPNELVSIIKTEGINIVMAESREHLMSLSMGGKDENMVFDVSYDVEGKGEIREAYVTRCKNGISINYDDTYMRRRDPDATVIADELPTDKMTHTERFGVDFSQTRLDTFEWIKGQKELLLMPFYSGNQDMGLGYPSLVVMPANAAFFAMALSDIQGFIPVDKIPNYFKPKAIVYVAPPFRHTHYNGKQVVVHNRLYDVHEVFSYNLYPGPSAKKGIYSVLLNIGEQEKWITLHASTVRIVTPYELSLTIMHEGASGGGKSEMIEPFHREEDGRLLLGTNIITGEQYLMTITDTSELHPVTDDMAIAHPSLQNNSGKLVVADAEDGWFLRVNHIDEYGTAPSTEKETIHPHKPLVFLNMDGKPGATCLIWEHIEDAPGKRCPNPRVIIPRTFFDNVVRNAVEVDVRSFGLRQAPSTRDNPNFGIAGLFHILPPALAWLWRLVAPRGYDNPSINESGGMKSEGVGSYWPFATGKMVDQANLLLDQILKTPQTKYILIPNQYIGAYKVGFSGQWATREYLSRRGGASFRQELLVESRCPILGYALESIKIDGTLISKIFLQTNLQPELGNDGFDMCAKILTDFFKRELEQFSNDPNLNPIGQEIINACMNDAPASKYLEIIQNL